MVEVDWKDSPTKFLGRNGFFNCVGVQIVENTVSLEPAILLEPITSQNRVGRCRIEIPRSKAREVAEALLKAAKE